MLCRLYCRHTYDGMPDVFLLRLPKLLRSNGQLSPYLDAIPTARPKGDYSFKPYISVYVHLGISDVASWCMEYTMASMRSSRRRHISFMLPVFPNRDLGLTLVGIP